MDFKSEKLLVDYFGLHIRNIKSLSPIFSLAKSLSEFDFNSSLASYNKNNDNLELLAVPLLEKNVRRKYTVKFSYSSLFFSRGVSIHFSGASGRYCYDLMKKKKLNFEELFQDLEMTFQYRFEWKISRFDIAHVESIRNLSHVEYFLKDCQKKVEEKKNRKTQLLLPYKEYGYCLQVGSRRSSNFYRIYEKKMKDDQIHQLKFELEIKKKKIQTFQELLFSEKFDAFEHEICDHFYHQSLDILCYQKTDYLSYTKWIIVWSRARLAHYLKKDSNFFITPYISENDETDRKTFETLEFLSFVKQHMIQSTFMNIDQQYCIVNFSLQSLFEFMSSRQFSKYSSEKMKKIFRNYDPKNLEKNEKNFLNLGFVMTIETENKIGTYPVYSGVVIDKKTGQCQIGILEEVYQYQCPFCYPSTFAKAQNSGDIKLKAELIKSCSTLNFEKEFNVANFFSTIKSSNKKKTELKNTLLVLLEDLKQFQRITPNFRVSYKNGSSHESSSLSLNLLQKAEKIIFWDVLPPMKKTKKTIPFFTDFSSETSNWKNLSQKMTSKRITFFTTEKVSLLMKE